METLFLIIVFRLLEKIITAAFRLPIESWNSAKQLFWEQNVNRCLFVPRTAAVLNFRILWQLRGKIFDRATVTIRSDNYKERQLAIAFNSRSDQSKVRWRTIKSVLYNSTISLFGIVATSEAVDEVSGVYEEEGATEVLDSLQQGHMTARVDDVQVQMFHRNEGRSVEPKQTLLLHSETDRVTLHTKIPNRATAPVRS